jgi:proton-translocating NADH-quinone oxidoreductase chain L
MVILVLLFPFLNTIFSGFLGFFLGNYGVAIISIICLSLTFFYSLLLFVYIALLGDVLLIPMWTWFNVGPFFLQWVLLYDSVTSIMFLVVTFISLLVHFYSIDYMGNDPHFPRFMSYLSLFTFFMLILVSADNFLQLFVGWEGVGLCSYLLISFWYTRIQANKAAIKALIVNRIGDFSLIIGISLCFFLYKTLTFSVIFALTPFLYTETFFVIFDTSYHLISLICFFFFIGAVGKSAQIGLHTWLPDAMEGPTPVSALIHAATMVTAGVFLIIRCSPLFEYAPYVLIIVSFFGALTAFFASTIGLVQHDLKKIIAYSTCSQLGYMIFACGLSNYILSFYHLTTHACFKALLFLCAGSVIHALADEQDMRKMGGLRKLLPFTYTMMLIGSFALVGFPFLAGFYSKDLIIEAAANSYYVGANFTYWLAMIAAIFTTIYSTRLLFFTFLDQPNGFKIIYNQIHEAPFFMAFPLFILAFLSILVGFGFQEIFGGLGTFFFGNSIFILPNNFQIIEMEFFPWYVKIIPIIFSLSCFLGTLIIYFTCFAQIYTFKLLFYSFYTFLVKKWFFDIIYNKFLVKPLFFFSYTNIYLILDKGLLEFFGPYGFKNVLLPISKQIHYFHTGIIYHYFCFMFFGFLILFFFFI